MAVVATSGRDATIFSPVTEMTAEDYRRVSEVTYLGVVHGTLTALRHMRPRNDANRQAGPHTR